MAKIEQGKRMNLRWTNSRMNSIRALNWEDLDSATAVDRAFNMAEELDQIIYAYDRFLKGDLSLGELMKKLNETRRYK